MLRRNSGGFTRSGFRLFHSVFLFSAQAENLFGQCNTGGKPHFRRSKIFLKSVAKLHTKNKFGCDILKDNKIRSNQIGICLMKGGCLKIRLCLKGVYSMKQCEKGHIYDEKTYSSCPYCNQSGSAGTRPLDNAAPDFPKTTPLNAGGEPSFPSTLPLDAPEAPKAPARPKKEMSATIALNVNEVTGISPVCGWLVVVEGDNKGASFNIHSEKNTIGRGSGFDVNLSFDKAISKEGDAVLTYDSRSKKFFITLAAGKNNVYHNGNLLLTPEEVKDYDVLEVGATKLVFRSFCNDGFTY